MFEATKQLSLAIDNIYKPAGLQITMPVQREFDPKGFGYVASRFGLNGNSIVFRVAKTTPDRPGQFVTLWKRPVAGGDIVPLDFDDDIDFVVVDVMGHGDGEIYRGQFIFSKRILVEKKIMSSCEKGGKLAIRVFPPWSEELTRGAVKKVGKMSGGAKETQKWQLKYYFPILENGSFDSNIVKKLFLAGN